MPRAKQSPTPGKVYPNRRDLAEQVPQAGVTGNAPPAAEASMSRSLAPPVSPPAPGSLASLTDPTSRPAEPLTTGMDMGPGLGSEALPRMVRPLRETENPWSTIEQVLRRAPRPNSDLAALADYAALRASQPETQLYTGGWEAERRHDDFVRTGRFNAQG